MIDARLNARRGLYMYGDTTYPDQGVAAVCLSGMIAYHKMRLDGLRPRTMA